MREYLSKDGKFKLEVVPDQDAEDPRGWDNVGTLALFHNRYDLGDKGHGISDKDFSGWDEMEEFIRKEKDAAIILPVYLYDHSGLSIKVGSFHGLLPEGHARFDSGRVGFIFVSKEKVRKEYGGLSKKALAKAEKYLRGEIETYDQFLSGDIWGFRLFKKESCGEFHEVDSCWGFYGSDPSDNGIADHLSDKAQFAF